MPPGLRCWAGVAAYCFVAVVLAVQNPGLQNDEALLASGAVHMLKSPAEIDIPHDPNTWICAPGRCFPLMCVRYVGPIKDYLCLPLFAIFGVHTWIIRAVSILLAAVGLFGIGRLAGGVTALILAVNPTYVSMTVFDNGAVAPMMAGLGLFCLAISAYLRKPTAKAAMLGGIAAGFGIWARANYLFFLAALGLATLLVLRKRLLTVPMRHWTAFTGGGVFGGCVFLAYQVYSHGGTWQGLSMFAQQGTLGERVYVRVVMLAELLLSDREHRAIWAGPAMPEWQSWTMLMIVTGGCLVCLIQRDTRSRIAALTLLVLAAILCTSKLQLSEHHLVLLLPIAAMVVTLAISNKWIAGAVGVLYLLCAGYWQVAAINGLAKTGGVGVWSDGVYGLADELEQRYSNRKLKELDWGFEYNLYVLSGGRLHTRNVWADAGGTWIDEIHDGGVFLLNGPNSRQFPAASEGFLKALDGAGVTAARYVIRQTDDAVYAEVIDIHPQ